MQNFDLKPYILVLALLFNSNVFAKNYSEFCESQLTREFKWLSPSIGRFNRQTLPSEVEPIQKQMRQFERALEVCAHVYPVLPGLGDVWKEVRVSIGKGITLLEEYQNLFAVLPALGIDPDEPIYLEEELVQKREKFSAWKTEWLRLQTDFDLETYLSAPLTDSVVGMNSVSRSASVVWRRVSRVPTPREDSKKVLKRAVNSLLRKTQRSYGKIEIIEPPFSENNLKRIREFQKLVRFMVDLPLWIGITYQTAEADRFETLRNLLERLNPIVGSLTNLSNIENREANTATEKLKTSVNEDWAVFKSWLVDEEIRSILEVKKK